MAASSNRAVSAQEVSERKELIKKAMRTGSNDIYTALQEDYQMFLGIPRPESFMEMKKTFFSLLDEASIQEYLKSDVEFKPASPRLLQTFPELKPTVGNLVSLAKEYAKAAFLAVTQVADDKALQAHYAEVKRLNDAVRYDKSLSSAVISSFKAFTKKTDLIEQFGMKLFPRFDAYNKFTDLFEEISRQISLHKQTQEDAQKKAVEKAQREEELKLAEQKIENEAKAAASKKIKHNIKTLLKESGIYDKSRMEVKTQVKRNTLPDIFNRVFSSINEHSKLDQTAEDAKLYQDALTPEKLDELKPSQLKNNLAFLAVYISNQPMTLENATQFYQKLSSNLELIHASNMRYQEKQSTLELLTKLSTTPVAGDLSTNLSRLLRDIPFMNLSEVRDPAHLQFVQWVLSDIKDSDEKPLNPANTPSEILENYKERENNRKVALLEIFDNVKQLASIVVYDINNEHTISDSNIQKIIASASDQVNNEEPITLLKNIYSLVAWINIKATEAVNRFDKTTKLLLDMKQDLNAHHKTFIPQLKPVLFTSLAFKDSAITDPSINVTQLATAVKKLITPAPTFSHPSVTAFLKTKKIHISSDDVDSFNRKVQEAKASSSEPKASSAPSTHASDTPHLASSSQASTQREIKPSIPTLDPERAHNMQLLEQLTLLSQIRINLELVAPSWKSRFPKFDLMQINLTKKRVPNEKEYFSNFFLYPELMDPSQVSSLLPDLKNRFGERGALDSFINYGLELLTSEVNRTVSEYIDPEVRSRTARNLNTINRLKFDTEKDFIRRRLSVKLGEILENQKNSRTLIKPALLNAQIAAALKFARSDAIIPDAQRDAAINRSRSHIPASIASTSSIVSPELKAQRALFNHFQQHKDMLGISIDSEIKDADLPNTLGRLKTTLENITRSKLILFNKARRTASHEKKHSHDILMQDLDESSINIFLNANDNNLALLVGFYVAFQNHSVMKTIESLTLGLEIISSDAMAKSIIQLETLLILLRNAIYNQKSSLTFLESSASVTSRSEMSSVASRTSGAGLFDASEIKQSRSDILLDRIAEILSNNMSKQDQTRQVATLLEKTLSPSDKIFLEFLNALRQARPADAFKERCALRDIDIRSAPAIAPRAPRH